MTAGKFVVTSEVHGDFAGFSDQTMANQIAQELNSRLWNEIVYSPMAEVDFCVTMAFEREINQRYRNESYEVVMEK